MDNSQRLNELFNQAKNQEPKTTFEDTKATFKTSLKSGGGASKMVKHNFNFYSLKSILIMTLGIVTVGVSLFFFTNTANKSNPITSIENEAEKMVNKEAQIIEKVKGKTAQLEAQFILKKQLIDLKKKGISIAEFVKEETPTAKAKKVLPVIEEEYKFPVLTPKQIEANHKQKRKMVGKKRKVRKGKWYQDDPQGFLFIPAGTMAYKEKETSVNAFYMKQTEVSNLEYRTFLFDLLIQNRKDEFLMAKPDQTQWTKFAKGLQPMEANYFSHPAYNEYPVNNISREGAELYCKWFTMELQKNNPNMIVNDVRLPSDYEWAYAAKGGIDKSPYPWGGPYLRNARGCFLANFKPGAVKSADCDQGTPLKNTKDPDSLANYIRTGDNIVVPKQGGNQYSADGGFYTVKVSSYNPNGYGLYCMSGNIAEMVINSDDHTAVAKGGSWNSIGQHLQIEAEDLFVGTTKPNIELGFRPVMTYLGRTSSETNFKPFGTTRVSPNTYIDETEITNMSWKEYLKWIENTSGKGSSEYLAAYPDTNVWSNHLNYQAPYDKHYLSHPAYNNYPVVGVTYEQVVAFCKWRTDRVKEYFEKNPSESFPKNFVYRLPTKEEWEKVAAIEYSEKTKRVLEAKHKDSPRNNLKRALPVEGSKLTESADVTAPVKSYWPNKYGVYNLIGNVAEMVKEKGIAKGGSWVHTEAESTINNDIKYDNTECWLGFRCVFEVLD